MHCGVEQSGEHYGDMFNGGSDQQGTLPGVVAQVIHYDVTSEEEMKRSQAPCVSCLYRLLKKHGEVQMIHQKYVQYRQQLKHIHMH